MVRTTLTAGLRTGVFAGLRVLFVDDSSAEREMYRVMLERFGARVTAAATAGEAMEAFARNLPQLIVGDVAVDGGGMCELIRSIRALPPERGGRTPAVAITSASDPAESEDAIAAGFDACVTRPAGAEELALAVSSLGAAIEASRGVRRGPAPERERSSERAAGRTARNDLVVVEPRFGNRVVAALSESDRAALEAAAQRVRINAYETLQTPGTPVVSIFIPDGCLLSILCMTEGGKSVEVLSAGRNGMVGLTALLSDCPSPFWIQATIGGFAWKVGVRELRDLAAARPSLSRALTGAVHAQTVEIAQTAACNRAHRLDGQVARWILTACERTDSSVLRLTHETIAERLGTRRASVSVAIEGFHRAGLLRGARGSITVADFEGLRAAACECYSVVEISGKAAD